jgi:hypothetical protein
MFFVKGNISDEKGAAERMAFNCLAKRGCVFEALLLRALLP